MILSHIVAVSKNWVIGKDNQLPWKMPSDAKYFHDVTMGHPVIMGRKNYEANKKALPGRLNIVITRKSDFRPTDAVVVNSIDQALGMVNHPEVFIVGGGEIYRQTLEMADRIYITVIDTIAEGDTFYPKIDFSDYKILSKDRYAADKLNPFDWTYYILEVRR
ncbi:MAG: dihydrofolate reductase [Bacteroidales bacterium]